jgi:hypothetical protein
MTTPEEPSEPADLSDEVVDENAFNVVRDAYQAVYDSLSDSPTFEQIWRDNAYRGEFPEAFAHIGFLSWTGRGRIPSGRTLIGRCQRHWVSQNAGSGMVLSLRRPPQR